MAATTETISDKGRFLLKSIKSNYSILFAYVGIIIIFFSFSVILYTSETNAEISVIMEDENHEVMLDKEIVFNRISLIYSDILILSERQSIQEFLMNDSANNKQVVAEQFLIFANFSGIYDQVRLLDETGMEVIRIMYNYGNPFIVSESNLQNKSGRYYFRDVFSLDNGQVFVSPMDLNIEQGEIEQPLKPMIRIGTPVFDANNSKRGIVLVNYRAQLLLDKLSESPHGYGNITMLNSDGYWLLGIDPEDEWGFMYPSNNTKLKSTLSDQHPQAWDEINGSMTGQFYTEEGLLTFETIYPLSNLHISSTGSGRPFEPSNESISANEYQWKILSIVPNSVFNNIRNLNLFRYMSFFSIVLIISSISFLFIVVTNTRRKQELSEYTIQLEATNSELEAFSYSVSHDLRSPLGSIDGFSKLLLTKYSEMLDDKSKHYLDRIRAGIQNMGQVIEGILLLSRISRAEIHYETVDLTNICYEILDELHNSEPNRNVEFVVEEGLALECDAGQVRVVLMNLLSNAWKFTVNTPDARIDVGFTNFNGQSVIFVRDNGAGFDMSYAGKLFTPFQRLHTESEFSGSGIGLATVRRIVKRHGGTIWAIGAKDKGATFYFTFDGEKIGNGREE